MINRISTLLITLLLCWVKTNSQNITKVNYAGPNPGNLKMYTYTPQGLAANEKAPLIAVLHGCLQSAKAVAKQTGWNQLADKYKFRVLYPQQRVINNGAKCFCWFKNNDIEKGKGEVYSIQQMVEELKSKGNIDTTKVFVTGLSAGAAMAVVLMADYPATYNAGAIFAGGPYKVATNIWTATLAMYGWRIKSPEKWGNLVREQNPGYTGKYPKAIVYHGKADVVVNRRNSTELVKQWANLTGADPNKPEIITRFANNKHIEKRVFSNAEGETTVSYYRIKKMGHALPIDPGKCENQGGKRLPFARDKNFYSSYWVAHDFGLVSMPEISGPKTVNAFASKQLFTVSPTPTGTLVWNLPKGCTIDKQNGDGSVLVNWGKATGNISLTVTNESNKCRVTTPSYHVEVK